MDTAIDTKRFIRLKNRGSESRTAWLLDESSALGVKTRADEPLDLARVRDLHCIARADCDPSVADRHYGRLSAVVEGADFLALPYIPDAHGTIP